MLKKFTYSLFNKAGVSSIFRYFNRSKILILVYHGITAENRQFQPWTHISATSFEKQLNFIHKYYHVLHLSEAVNRINNDKTLPKNTAIITFDDGYKNNYTVAYPILKKFNLPATIYLTTGYINTNNILPMDQAFLIAMQANDDKSFSDPNINFGPITFQNNDERNQSYLKLTAMLKRFDIEKQFEYLSTIKEKLSCDYFKDDQRISDDFMLLNWEEVKQMQKSGLIEFGAHTVSHNILNRISVNDAHREISDSRKQIEEKLNTKISSFAYPNGNKGDYSIEHIEYLNKQNFTNAVTTIPELNKKSDSMFTLGRMSIGSDFTSDLDCLALRTSGLIPTLKRLVNYV